MPWDGEAMKDVAACDKRRGAGKQALIRRCPNGATLCSVELHNLPQQCGRSKPGEVEKLNKQRKRKKKTKKKKKKKKKPKKIKTKKDTNFFGVFGPLFWCFFFFFPLFTEFFHFTR